MKAYIITGAPGSGKSSLIDELSKEKGFTGLPEIPRILIKNKIAEKKGISPFTDLEQFFSLVFNEMYNQYLSVQKKEGIFFFDRALPDVLGYCYKFKIDFPIEFRQKVINSNFDRNVFFCPSWENIYTKDNERPYEFNEAKTLGKYLYKAYSDLGFNLDLFTESSVKDRINYIKDKVCYKK